MTDITLPRLSNSERIILEQLQGEEQFGLQLADNGAVKRGTVYVTLARMERKGYVASRQEALPTGAIGLPRRWYHATPYGRRILDAWKIAEQMFAVDTRAGARECV
ncbi:MAG TPA: helix-turn-helix transcriptional regulator [Vicinamibacterales bacterium]|nr:helix-turn-helix transcriptional regulator [Vicinamibacterales bacterium]